MSTPHTLRQIEAKLLKPGKYILECLMEYKIKEGKERTQKNDFGDARVK